MERAGTSRVVVITGAASGIGQAAALAFADLGDLVVALDVADLTATSTLADGRAGRLVARAMDVTDEAAVGRVVAGIAAEFGGIDVAFNNAGVVGPSAALHELPLAAWRRVIDVDLDGVFHCMRHELAIMVERGQGAIVNTSSTAVHHATPRRRRRAAAKHGVIGLTRAAAVEYAGAGIRINAVLPGVVRTPMLEASIGDDEARRQYFAERSPTGRMAEPAEVAALVVWLCSAEASYVNGACMVVDGAATV